MNDFRAVLDRIRDAGLKLKPAKCKLFCEQVLYLGHVISPAGVSTDPRKLSVLADWPVPTTVRELQSFLGFVNFHSEFIDEQMALTSSLYNLTAMRKGTEPVHFTRENIERFAELKRRLFAAVSLAHLNLEAPFTLYTDASTIAVSAVLFQRDTAGVERPISSSLNSYPLRRETIPSSSASASQLSARSSTSESSCLRARFACELTIAHSSGSSQRSPRRRRESPDYSRRSWSTRCKSSTYMAVKTRSQTRCFV